MVEHWWGGGVVRGWCWGCEGLHNILRDLSSLLEVMKTLEASAVGVLRQVACMGKPAPPTADRREALRQVRGPWVVSSSVCG